jgi:hypothetical protein
VAGAEATATGASGAASGKVATGAAETACTGSATATGALTTSASASTALAGGGATTTCGAAAGAVVVADGPATGATGGLTTTATAGGATATAGRAGTEPTGGRAITGPAGGRAPIAGPAGAGGATMIFGAWRGWGTILRGSGRTSAGRAATGGGVTTRNGGGATAGRAVVSAEPAGGRTTTAGGAEAGRCGYCACRSASCFRARMAFITSPGLEILDRSILGRFSSFRELPAPEGREPRSKYPRTRSASPDSIELEWVLPSARPIASRASRICLLLTSSSRARSLIRTLLIRLFSLPCPVNWSTCHSNLTANCILPIAIIL